MAKNKKLTTTLVAVTAAAALLLSGTFAWQSINQTALNEASDVVNPGGRLHDDFDGTNKDIYVENFADEPIYARVRLNEYFEVVMNYGKEGVEVTDIVAGSKTEKDDPGETDETGKNLYDYTYDIHYFDQENATDAFWNWTMGSSESEDVWYMPTFNLNKDSLVADVNGTYRDTLGGISNRDDTQYLGYMSYAEGDTEIGTEIYDGDANNLDEVGNDFNNLGSYADNIVTVEDVEHAAVQVGDTNGLISMAEWLELYNNGEVTDNYWVYDTDGWVYWSSPIAGGTTTGLLMDGIALKGVMDDTWYYAINVVAQFVTADDIGDGTEENPGFKLDGMTPEAEALLKAIGVDVDGTGSEESENPKSVYVTMSGEPYTEYHVNVYDTIELTDGQGMRLSYEDEDGAEVVLERDVQYTLDDSTVNGYMYTVVLTDETLVGRTITVGGKDVTGTDVIGAYLIVDGVAVRDDKEEPEDSVVTQTIQIKDFNDKEVAFLTSDAAPYTLTLLDDDGSAIETTDWAVTWEDGSDVDFDVLSLTNEDDGTATIAMGADTTSGVLKITAGEAVNYVPVNYNGDRMYVYVEYEEADYYYVGREYGFDYTVEIDDEDNGIYKDITHCYTPDEIVCTVVYTDDEDTNTTDVVTVANGKISSTAAGEFYPKFAVKGKPNGRTAEITFTDYVETPENATETVNVMLQMADGSAIPDTVEVGQTVYMDLAAVASYEDGTALHETHYTVDWQVTGGVRGDTYINSYGTLVVASIERAEQLTVTAVVTVDDGMEGRTTTEFTASENIAVEHPTVELRLTDGEGDELSKNAEGNYVINVSDAGATVHFAYDKVTAPDGNQYGVDRSAAHAHETDTVYIGSDLDGAAQYMVYLKDGDTQVMTVDYSGLYADVFMSDASYSVVLQLEAEYAVGEEKYVAEGFATLVVNPATT